MLPLPAESQSAAFYSEKLSCYMRKVLFLFLLLAGCQSDKMVDPATAAQLQGSWINTAVEEQFYDVSDNLVYETAKAPAGIVYKFKDNNLTISLDSTLITSDTTSSIKTLRSLSFKLSDSNGLPRITFTLSGSSSSSTAIKSVSGTNMEWEDVFADQAYTDSTETKTAAKMVVRHSFTRKP